MTTPATPPHDPGRHNGPDDLEADLPVLRSLKEQDQNNRIRTAGIVGGVASFLLIQLVPGSGWLFAVLGVPFAIGAVVGRYVLRGQARIRSVASWSGLAAWFLPILGMLVSGAVFVGQDPARPIVRERVLAGVTFLLSLANTIVGVLMKRA
jgi:hypothetical protein